MIRIVDYGMGNLGSILNLCRYLDLPAGLCRTPEEIARAERLILPGVGSFDSATRKLAELGLDQAIRQAHFSGKIPLLGICLGMQLLCDSSEEGLTTGLGLIRGRALRIVPPAEGVERLLVPHMGWNTVTQRPESRLLANLPQDPRFYFVHSYHVVCDDSADRAATVQYGSPLTAAIERGLVFGTQFHPEKSHRFGMQVIRNFSKL